MDANILIYSVIKESPFCEASRNLVEKYRTSDINLYLSPQTILEYTAVLTSHYKEPKKKVAEGVEKFLSDSLFLMIYPREQTISIFQKFLRDEVEIHVTDLFFAATAISNGIDTIITADSDFGKIKGIKVLNPFE